MLNYRVRDTGRERRITIGSATDWNTTGARARARELRRAIDDGKDPLGLLEETREAPTVSDLADCFEKEHLPRKRPSTAADYRRMLANHIRPHFGRHKKVSEVVWDDIDKLHRKITSQGSPYAANRCVAVLSKMFSLAIKSRMRTDHPVKGIERNAETKRKRYLTADELERLTAALAARPVSGRCQCA